MINAFFEGLSPENQALTKARFLDAGPKDGYIYKLDRGGKVLSRIRLTATPKGEEATLKPFTQVALCKLIENYSNSNTAKGNYDPLSAR